MMMGYIMKLVKTLRDLLPREECREESESFARAIKAVFDSAWHEDRSELSAYMLEMLQYGVPFSITVSRIAVISLNTNRAGKKPCKVRLQRQSSWRCVYKQSNPTAI